VAPVRSRAVAGHEGHWILEFATEDLDLHSPDRNGVVAVGVFPEGPDRPIPRDDWATARVPPPGRGEREPLNVSIDVGDVDSSADELVPVEVRFEREPSTLVGPEAVRMGPERAFDAGGAGTVSIADPEPVATPESVSDFGNPHDAVGDRENPRQHGKLMEFSVDEVVPPAERGEVTLALGLFPDGPDARVPPGNWDTDVAWIPPRGTDN
jgi:hypothetical protein